MNFLSEGSRTKERLSFEIAIQGMGEDELTGTGDPDSTRVSRIIMDISRELRQIRVLGVSRRPVRVPPCCPPDQHPPTGTSLRLPRSHPVDRVARGRGGAAPASKPGRC